MVKEKLLQCRPSLDHEREPSLAGHLERRFHDPRLANPGTHELGDTLLDAPLAWRHADQLVDVLAVRGQKMAGPASFAEMRRAEIGHCRRGAAVGVEVDVLGREVVLGRYGSEASDCVSRVG